MEITAQLKNKPSGTRQYLVSVTEIELDKLTGVAGLPSAGVKYKLGAVVNVGKIYNKVKHLNEKKAEILAAAAVTKTSAEEIENSYPIEEP